MRGVNKVTLIGNLGSDPEVKYTQGGMAVATLSIATSSTRKDRDGNQVEETQWHRCKAFGKVAEILGEYAKKGGQLYIEGTIRYSKVEKDGETKYFTDIIVNEFQFLGGGGQDGERREPQRQQQRPQQQRQQPRREAPPAQRNDFGSDFADDDIPF